MTTGSRAGMVRCVLFALTVYGLSRVYEGCDAWEHALAPSGWFSMARVSTTVAAPPSSHRGNPPST